MDYRRLSAREIEQRARNIHPGSWAVGATQPLSTRFGSCVAVCLFDPLSRIGGLDHFMLPSIGRRSHAADSLLGGDRAMATAAMIEREEATYTVALGDTHSASANRTELA